MPGFDWQNATNPVAAADMVYDHVGIALYGGYDGQPNSITSAAANSSHPIHLMELLDLQILQTFILLD